MKYCVKCGNELVDEAILCPKCGCLIENDKMVKNSHNGGKIFSLLFTVFYYIFLALAITSLFIITNMNAWGSFIYSNSSEIHKLWFLIISSFSFIDSIAVFVFGILNFKFDKKTLPKSIVCFYIGMLLFVYSIIIIQIH